MSHHKPGIIMRGIQAIRNIANSKGGKDLGGWLAHGSTELMNLAIHTHAAPMYAHNAAPPDQGNVHGHSPEAMQELQKFELNQRMEKMHTAHNQLSAQRDQQFNRANQAHEAMTARMQNHEAPEQGMSR